jgi:hypothetical protein
MKRIAVIVCLLVPLRATAQTVLQGSFDASVIRRVANRNRDGVRRCWDDAVRGHPDLSGRVVIRFVIGPDGTVKSAFAQASDLAGAVQQCLSAAVRSWRFPKPESGAVTVSYPFTLRKQVDGFGARDDDGEVQDQAADMQVVRDVIKRHLAETRACYARQLQEDPTLEGEALIKLTIAASGDVESATVVDSDVEDAGIEACIADVARRWVFPRNESGGKISVKYSVVLRRERSPSAPSPPATGADAVCARDSQEMVPFLRQLPQWPDEDASIPLACLVEADGDKLTRGEDVVLLADGTIECNGHKTKRGAGQIAELKELLTTWKNNEELLHPGRFDGSVRLAIGADVTWSKIVEVVSALAERQYVAVQLVTWKRRAHAIVPPSESAADRAVAEAQRAGGIDKVVDMLDEQSARCPPLKRGFHKLVERRMAYFEGNEAFAAAVFDMVPQALRTCHCQADVRTVRAALFWLFAPADLARGLFQTSLRTVGAPGAASLALPGDTLWRNAAPRLFEVARHAKSHEVHLSSQ